MRHPFIARQDDSFLVVIDLQTSLWQTTAGSERALRGIRFLLQAASILGLPVIATEQNPARLGSTMPQVARLLGDAPVIAKMTFGCYCEPAFAQAVEALGRRTAVVCGGETHICVLQTALDLLHVGYRVHLPADAVAERGEINRRIALGTMRAAGAVVTTAESLVFQWLERAGTDEFRAAVGLIKDYAAQQG